MFSYKRNDCAGGRWRLMENNTRRHELTEHLQSLQALTELEMLSEKESRGISHLFFPPPLPGSLSPPVWGYCSFPAR